MKVVSIIILCIVTLFISSCAGGGGIGGPSDGPADEDYKKGTSALSVNFVPNSPPTKMLQATDYYVGVQLENNGAALAKNGKLALVYDRTLFEENDRTSQSQTGNSRITDNIAYFELEGKSADFPQGEKDVVMFSLTTIPLIQQSQIQETQFIAKVCYDYQTDFVEFICVDPDPFNLQTTGSIKKTCIQQTIAPGSKGSPVVVDAIQPEMLPDESGGFTPRFSLQVRKVSGASIYLAGAGETICGTRETNLDVADIAEVTVYLADSLTSCNKEKIKFIENTATVVCEMESFYTTQQTAYETPLRVVIDFGISETFSKKVDITRT